MDRRDFIMGAVATTATTTLPALPVSAIEDEPDPWEARLREIEMFTGLLRKNRLKIAAIGNDPALSEAARRELQYMYSTVADHCARMIQISANHTAHEARGLLNTHWAETRIAR